MRSAQALTLKVDDPDLSRSASLSVLAAYARTAPSAALTLAHARSAHAVGQR